MSDLYRRVDACRSCGCGLDDVIDFGLVHLNAFPLPDDPLPRRAPVTVVRCRACGLVQLGHTVERDALFRQYYYRTETQPQMVKDVHEAVHHALSLVTLEPGDNVLSIGCNDGTELRAYPSTVHRIGVDPALNLRTDAWRVCDEVHSDYFPQVAATPKPCKVITSLACLYDVDDLPGFVEGIKRWLHPDGVWCLQVSYLPDTLKERVIGDFCHEHVSFFSAETLEALLRRHHLQVVSFLHNAVNGGSIRMIVRHGSGAPAPKDNPSYQSLRDFADEIGTLRTAVRRTLEELRSDGQCTLGYGASTKLNFLLSVFQLGPDLISAIADRDPRKWGRTTVTGIPIISEEEGRLRDPDVFFVGIPQFLGAIRKREAAFLERGGRLLVPFPVPTFVDGPVPVAG